MTGENNTTESSRVSNERFKELLSLQTILQTEYNSRRQVKALRTIRAYLGVTTHLGGKLKDLKTISRKKLIITLIVVAFTVYVFSNHSTTINLYINNVNGNSNKTTIAPSNKPNHH